MNNKTIIMEIVWLMQNEAHNGVGPINWEQIATRLYDEGYINEQRKNKQDKASSKNIGSNNKTIDQ